MHICEHARTHSCKHTHTQRCFFLKTHEHGSITCSFSLLHFNCCRFGFVEFSSPDDAAKAYDELQNTEIDGRQVFLDFASPGMCVWFAVAILTRVDTGTALSFFFVGKPVGLWWAKWRLLQQIMGAIEAFAWDKWTNRRYYRKGMILCQRHSSSSAAVVTAKMKNTGIWIMLCEAAAWIKADIWSTVSLKICLTFVFFYICVETDFVDFKKMCDFF